MRYVCESFEWIGSWKRIFKLRFQHQIYEGTYKRLGFENNNIRDSIDLNEVFDDELYGRLKTRDLEIQQRKIRKSSKMDSVALNVEAKQCKQVKNCTKDFYSYKGLPR